MKTSITSGILLAAVSATAGAQGFGVMQSAEIIETGNYKLAAYPVFVDEENTGDDDAGLAFRAGYGFNRIMDGELKYASYDDMDYLGADLEFNLSRQSPLDVSLALGGSLGDADRGNRDTRSLDTSLSVTGHVSPPLEIGAAMAMSRIKVDDVPPGADDDFTELHFVPTMEFRLLRNVDLLAEYGVAMNDESADYLAVGAAVYMQ